jgi:ribosomal protein L37AE/L43A
MKTIDKMKTTKLENKLQAIYEAAGYDIECDNRSYDTRNVNKVLSIDGVKLILVKNGYVRISQDGKKWNLAIAVNGKGKSFLIKRFDPDVILDCITRVTTMPHVKEAIRIQQDAYICPKCHGEGHIEAFRHISNGICFDCMGIGYKFHSGNWSFNTINNNF